MTHRGFSLIELVITILISSILFMLLYNVLNQTTTTASRIEGVTAADIPIMTFYDRFERDITGIFVPPIGDPNRADKAFAKHFKQTQELEEKQKEEQDKQAKPALVKPAQAKPIIKPVSLQDIQVKKVFIYEEKDANLTQFSFITCNPLAVYHQKNPRIVRVTYTLKRDRDSKTQNFMLQRKESLKLELTDEQAREYTLLYHISSLKLELLAPQQTDQKETKSGEPADKKAKAAPLQSYHSWPQGSEESDKDSKKIGKDLPQFVKVSLRYIDPVSKQENSYTFTFPILCFRAPSQSILDFQLIHQQREAQKKQMAEQEQTDKTTQTKTSLKNPLAALMQPQDPHQRANTVGAGR